MPREHLAVVEEIVDHTGFLLVDLLHILKAADVVFEPFEHQLANVDVIAGGSVNIDPPLHG